MMNKKVAVWVVLATAVIFALTVARAFGSTTQPRPNSLGITESYQNPNTYLLGLPVDGKILDGRFTNIRFKPYAAASLFDESILFCGDVREMFEGKTGPLVITYRTQASGMFEGVGCHTLVSAFTVNGR